MSNLDQLIEELKRDEALGEVELRLAGGESVTAILDDCRAGMARVGELFQEGEYFLADLILSAEIFKSAAALLEPHINPEQQQKALGKVLLATMRGDIHDLGKNILATLFRVHSFEVHDLGVNVEPEDLVQEVKDFQPDFVGISALITTSFESAKEATDQLEKEGLRDGIKILVGGAVTTPEVKTYLGADFQTHDATAGVAYCVNAMGGC